MDVMQQYRVAFFSPKTYHRSDRPVVFSAGGNFKFYRGTIKKSAPSFFFLVDYVKGYAVGRSQEF